MTTDNNARKAHKILDDLLKGNMVLDEESEFLRQALPERPKQKTLEEITTDVLGAWSCTSDNYWGGNSCYPKISIEDWLGEIHAQLKGLEDMPAKAPEHPEFLKTEGDYTNAPAGTIVAKDCKPGWTKLTGGSWDYSSDTDTNYGMYLSGPRRVLRWGWGDD